MKTDKNSELDMIDKLLISIVAVLTVVIIGLLTSYYFKYFHSMDISCTEDFDLNEYMVEIDKIPESIKKSFILNQWSVSIENEQFIEHANTTGREAVGLTAFKSKKIFLRGTNSVIHEFGHYLQYVLNEDYNKRIELCYEKEGKQYFDNRNLYTSFRSVIKDTGEGLMVYFKNDKILGYIETPATEQRTDTPDDQYNYFIDNYYYEYPLDPSEITYPELGQYANVSDKEYFSQYFKYWINNRNNAEKMKLLQEKTPETYKLFIELESKDWCMENNTLAAMERDIGRQIGLLIIQCEAKLKLDCN